MFAAASPSVSVPGEESTPLSLQRMWDLTRARHARGETFSSPFERDPLDTFERAQEPAEIPVKRYLSTQSDVESDAEEIFHEPEIQGTIACESRTKRKISRGPVVLDAGLLGDIPAVYVVPPLALHQLPVIGVYIDPRVHTGFRYRVRPLQGLNSVSDKKQRYLFGGKALTLQSIGRGFARRFTFEPADSTLNNNDNYFWSDSRPEGFSFEIEAVSVGDKFTVFDANHNAQGTMEIVQLEKEQYEQDCNILHDGTIEKFIKIDTLCKLEWYEKNGEATVIPMSGIAVVKKHRGKSSACVTKVIDVTIGHSVKTSKKGYELKPGIQSCLRRINVSGELIGDVPTMYSIVGLQPYEEPVIGTFIDPRIIAGFHYKVRPAGCKRHLFQGRALLLKSIGMGYGKRITFAPDSLNEPNNYFWSDSQPDGFGFEPRAIHVGMKFEVKSNGEHLGEAQVFRADLPQVEQCTEFVTVPGKSKKGVVKHIQVDVTCHMKLATTGGGSVDSEVHLIRVSGVAVVQKDPDSSVARVVNVYDVGLDSQLNQLFVQSQTELTFHPLP